MEFLVLVQVPGLQKLEMYVYVELLLSQEDISPLLMWQWELSTKFFSSLKSNNYFKCYKFLEHVEDPPNDSRAVDGIFNISQKYIFRLTWAYSGSMAAPVPDDVTGRCFLGFLGLLETASLRLSVLTPGSPSKLPREESWKINNN